MGSRPVTLSAAAQKHVDDTVRVWLGLRGSADVPTLPEPLARLVLRLEEYERTTRDRWGCWDHTFSENRERLQVAELDHWLAARNPGSSRCGRTADRSRSA